ncbi:unnamed protein product [Schistosoma turkestanicum]|nr:unnamed protein product [Schistosoma turkestanicum]
MRMKLSQNPYFNIMKHYPFSSWRKRGNGDDIHLVMDSTLNSKVMLIDGLVTAANHLTVPKNQKCSLSLTGEYLYLIVKPLKDKNFIVRLDCRTKSSITFRITVSNARKFCKVSNLCVCLPLSLLTISPDVEEPKWVVLRFDLRKIVNEYSIYQYHSLSRLQICCSLLLYAAFTSNNEYSPLVSIEKNKVHKNLVLPLPKEFRPFLGPEKLSETFDLVSIPESITDQFEEKHTGSIDSTENINLSSSTENKNPEVASHLTESKVLEDINIHDKSIAKDHHKLKISDEDERSCRISDVVQFDNTSLPCTNLLHQTIENMAKNISMDLVYIASCPSYCTSLIITQNGCAIIFPCAAYIIVMDVGSRRQCFLEGHTAEVTGVCQDADGRIIASCQSSTLSSINLYLGVVHVWRMPDLLHSSLHIQKPLGTGRVQNAQSLKGVCISDRCEFLIAYGMDVRLRGMIVVWDLRNLLHSSVLPLLVRSTIDNTIGCLCLLPNNYKQNANPDCYIRFATLSGSNTSHDTIIDWNIQDKHQCARRNSLSEIRLWRLKYDASVKQDTIQQSTSRNKYHLSSSVISLNSVIVPMLRQSFNFVSCCIKPQLENFTQSHDKLNYSLLVGSSTGHILEVDLNLFCISNIYHLIAKSQEENLTDNNDSNTVELQISASREFRNNQWILTVTDHVNHSKLHLISIASIHWINPGINFSLGWLAVCTKDGRLFLLESNNSSNSVLLSVKYPSMISALDSCPCEQDTVNVNSQHQVYISIATRSGGLACLDLNFEFDFHKNATDTDENEMINEFKLINCSPKRILSWQAHSPIIATDLVQIDKQDSQCILATLSNDGALRIRHISSQSSLANQLEDVEIKRINVDKTCINKELVENPLVDLIISDETPTCIAIRPKLNWSESKFNDMDNTISWIQIACGYSKTGLVRVFSPVNAQMLYESNFHKGYDVTALLYSPCGSYLYTSDSSGQLAVWRIIHNDTEKFYDNQLLHSLNYQIGVFSTIKPPQLTMRHHDNSSMLLLETKKSIITISSKGSYIAYMGPQLEMLTIAKGVSVLTRKQIDLNHLVLKYFPNNQTKSNLNQNNNSLNFIQFISRCNKIEHLTMKKNDTRLDDYTVDDDDEFLFVSTSQGYLFKFNLFDNKLIACAEFNVISNSKSTIYMTAMKIAPNGQTLLLTESSTPFIYLTSTDLYPLYDENNHMNNKTTVNRSIIYQKFTGHIYPIDNIYITLNEQYCISIDTGFWCQSTDLTKTNRKTCIAHNTNQQTNIKASSIFIWKFNSAQRLPDVKMRKNTTFVQPLVSCEYENKSTPINQCTTTTTMTTTLETNHDQNVTSSENCHIKNIQANTHCNNYPLSHRHWTVYAADSKLNRIKQFQPNLLLEQLKFTFIHDHCMKGFIVGFGCYNQMIDNLIWDSDTGIFLYTYESMLVIEELETGLQLAYRSVASSNNLDDNNNINFTGEIFNSLALAPNKTMLAIGSTSYWQSNEDHSRSTSISSFIIVPMKFMHYHGKRQFNLILKYDQSRRFLLPILVDKKSSSEQVMINTNPLSEINTNLYGILLSMTFTLDSRHLITIEDYRTNEVKLWSVADWTLLSTIQICGYFNQILCSPLFSNEFITIGAEFHNSNHDNHVQFSNHESSILFWKFNIKYSSNCVNDDELVNIDNNHTINTQNILTYTRGKNWSFNENKLLRNTEFCSATYLQIPNKYKYYTTMLKMILLIIVSDNFGNISIWDGNNHMCLHNFSADCNEISVISSCGPHGFVTGNTNGLLRYWRLEIEFFTNEQYSNYQNNNYHNRIKNVEAKHMKSISHFDNEVILSACFDIEGHIGVISTNNCNLWYIDWSEVEEWTSHALSPANNNNNSASITQDYSTLLCSGYKTPIIGLIWWTKPQSLLLSNENSLNNNNHNNDLNYANDLLLTCSLDGNVQLWNPDSCQFIAELKTNELVNSLNGSIDTIDLCLLDYPDVMCVGSEVDIFDNETLSSKEDNNNNNHNNNRKSPGCLAIAYTDTCVRLFCLHKMCLISESVQIFPQLDDQITVIQFCSPYYLIIGTRNGLLLLLSISHHIENNINNNNNSNTNQQYPQPILIKRIIKDYLVDYHQISMPILCLHTYSQPLLYDYYLHRLQQNKKQQINNSIIKSDITEDNQSESWICLAIGAENRLSIWNLSICSNHSQHNPVRFYLIVWLPLESLKLNDMNNKENDKNQPVQLSYYASFLPTQNLKDILKLNSYTAESYHELDNPYIMIYAINAKTEMTNLWIYSIDELLQTQAHHSLPSSSSSLCLQLSSGKVESITPVFIFPTTPPPIKTAHNLLLSCLQFIVLTRSTLNPYQTVIQLIHFQSNSLQIQLKQINGPQYVYNNTAFMNKSDNNNNHQPFVSSNPLIKSIMIPEKQQLYIAAAYGKELLIWLETDIMSKKIRE